MYPPRFRTRLLAILLAFALVPSALLTIAWGMALWRTAPLVTGSGAWERIAASGESAIAAARRAPLSRIDRAAIDAYEQDLRLSLEQARRYRYIAARTAAVLSVLALLALGLLALVASRVAGHLSRQLSRPIDELVGWTELVAHGTPIPDIPPRRGAPEFETLRSRMRRMAAELEAGRREALEAERLRAFRESARRVAHELKNPLTPIRLAAARIAKAASPELAESVEVLTVETERLDRMARSFAEFGRLPEGSPADIDMGELARYAASSTVPPHLELEVHVEPELAHVRGHYDALSRAISNVVLNAVEACGDAGRIDVGVTAASLLATPAVKVTVRDSGCGIPAAKLAAIWEPYITDKPGGTGLGLAIARQAVLAHGGEVRAVSTPGSGTTVELVVPVAPPPPPT